MPQFASIVPAGEAWPSALCLAAELIDQRGFSPRYLQHPETGALAIDTALKLALGYTWQLATGQDDEGDSVRALVAPSKDAAKLLTRMEQFLRAELTEQFVAQNPGAKLPSIGWWNTSQDENAPELPALMLRLAAARYEADRARTARYRAKPR